MPRLIHDHDFISDAFDIAVDWLLRVRQLQAEGLTFADALDQANREADDQETPKVPTFSDLWVCQECYWMHTYGVIGNGPSTFDTTSVDEYLRRQAEVADAYRTANDQGQLSDNVDSETGEGINDFSWSACECCGSTLGGARYRLAQRDA